MRLSVSALRPLFAFSLLLVLILSMISLSNVPAASQPFFRTWGGVGDDSPSRVALGPTGDIYITGFTTSFGAGHEDVFLLRYDSAGNLLTQETWGGVYHDAGTGIAVDSSGNAYVTGGTSSFGSAGAFLLKFNPQGQIIWQLTWPNGSYPAGTKSSGGGGVALDTQGHIYMTGTYYPSYPAYGHLFLLKLDSNGSLLWQRVWAGNKTDEGSDVVVDAAGAVYVLGWTESFDASGFCFPGPACRNNVLLKFNSTGSLQWQRVWRDTEPYAVDEQPVQPAALAVDSSGNIYVAGQVCYGDCNFYEVALSKLNSTGGLVWEETWPRTRQIVDTYGANDLAVDSSGNIYVTGNANGTVLLMKLASNGTPYTIESWGGRGGQSGMGIAIDASSSPIITGFTGAPGYQLHTSSVSLDTANSSIIAPAVSARPLNLSTTLINGTLTEVTGKTSYAGGIDVFLNYSSSFPVPTFPSTLAIAAVALIIALFPERPRKRDLKLSGL